MERRSGPPRPARLVAGVAIAVASAGALAALTADAGNRDRVLALRRDVPAGAALAREDLDVVSIAVDAGVGVVGASMADEFVGQFARYDLAAGALLTPVAVQPRPLVTPGRVLVAVPVSLGELPAGLATGDDVLVVVAPPAGCGGGPAVVAAVVAATPASGAVPNARTRAAATSVSLEVAASDVATVALGEAFTIALPNTPLPAPAPPASPATCVDLAAGSGDGGGPAPAPAPTPRRQPEGSTPHEVVSELPADLLATTTVPG